MASECEFHAQHAANGTGAHNTNFHVKRLREVFD
jgi:hypothetical protein